ncbi:MAG: dCTP deaminase [Alphaproteobacteria bacterium]|nr:dCTP deaminase [Alphaproteobacteria bacterium]
MILTGPHIAAAIAAGDITLTPFDGATNPNSVDIRLGATLRDHSGLEIDAAADAPLPPEQPLPAEGVWLRPGGLYTAESRETFGSSRYVPIVHGKSSIARAGLFVHVNGDMVDLGVVAPFTFQLVPTAPILVRPGMAIAQVTFWTVSDAL